MTEHALTSASVAVVMSLVAFIDAGPLAHLFTLIAIAVRTGT